RLVSLRFDPRGADLWRALYRAGRPVQYSYAARPYPLWTVQTRYASRPWAVEPPSAGLALTWDLLLDLRRLGVPLSLLTPRARPPLARRAAPRRPPAARRALPGAGGNRTRGRSGAPHRRSRRRGGHDRDAGPRRGRVERRRRAGGRRGLDRPPPRTAIAPPRRPRDPHRPSRSPGQPPPAPR